MAFDLNNLRIRQYPDPCLREVATTVTQFDEELAALSARMLTLMHQVRGVGLAAPQVGVALRLFVMNPTGDVADDLVIVNPQLTAFGSFGEADEGCLSLPGVNVVVRRRVECRLVGQDLAGAQITAEADGLIARIWQHETDHLFGRLIIDSMSPADEIANRKILKSLSAGTQ